MTHEEKLEIRRVKRRATYQKNKDKILEENRQWRKNSGYKPTVDKAKKAKWDKKYYEKNKNKILANVKEYASENKESIAKRVSEYYKTPQGKMVALTSRQKRRGYVMSTEDGTVTTDSLMALMKEQDNKCYHCSSELDHDTPRAVHLDHLIPLSKGGEHTLTNVAWSCAYCNLTKNDKI